MARPAHNITETRFPVRMPKNMREAVNEQAEAGGESAASWIRRLIFDHLDPALVARYGVERPEEITLPKQDFRHGESKDSRQQDSRQNKMVS